MTTWSSVRAEDFSRESLDALPITMIHDMASGLVGDLPVGHMARLSVPTTREDIRLELLVVRRDSPTIVTSFHGALDRNRFTLPRFERLTTLARYPHSLVLVADPTLHLGPNFQLGWYVGWSDFDVQATVARLLADLERLWGTTRMVHTGSSGGGFAALHMAALLPRSEAVAFNAQTSIHAYLAGGTSYSAQRMFIRCVLPDLFDSTPTDATLRKDWTHVLGERASCFARFEGSEAKGRVTMVQNVDRVPLRRPLPALCEAHDDAGARH